MKKIPLYFFLSFAFFQITMEKEIRHSKDEKNTIKDLFYMKIGFFLKSMFKHLRSFTLHLLYLFMN